MKNKKGFTLIELLAVIVILAIIALVAVPIVLNMIESARKSAAKSSALGYIEAIEYNNELYDYETSQGIENSNYVLTSDGEDIEVEDISIKLKGQEPDYGTVTIQNKKVIEADLCINGYNIIYEKNDVKIGTDNCSSTPITKIVTITFVSEGETIDTVQLNKKSKIGTFPSVTNGDYPLIGWFTEETNGTQVNENTQVRSNATYYAHWDKRFTTSRLSVGDLIEMTPSGNKFTPDSTKTGYSNQSEFDPKDLTIREIGSGHVL